MPRSLSIPLPYLAGIIDGEGCIGIRRSKPSGSRRTPAYIASLTVGNTSRALIEEIVSAFLIGCVTYRAGTEKREACYVWSVQSLPAATIVRTLRPYLLVKRPQADILLEFMDGFESFRGARPGHKGGQLVSMEELSRREALYVRMKALNRNGPRQGEPAIPLGKKSVGVTAAFFAEVRAKALLDRDALDLVADSDPAHDIHS